MFTMAQRHALAIKEEDVFFNFIYQIGVMLEDHPDQEIDPGNVLRRQFNHCFLNLSIHKRLAFCCSGSFRCVHKNDAIDACNVFI